MAGLSQWPLADTGWNMATASGNTLTLCVCVYSIQPHVHNNTATDTAAACLVFVKSISD